MDGQTKSQRVVMIHDASGEVRLKGVRWALDGFLLKDGDVFTLVSVVHQIHHPMGYKIRVDSSMFGGANQKAIDEEVAKKKKEHDDNLQLVEISKLYQMRKVDFKIELVVGPIPKNVGVDTSKKCKATWVILDRRMKKDKKYFLEKLSCGISTMKNNDDITDIRGPRRKHQTLIPYAVMLPSDNKISTTEAHNDQELFSIEFDSPCASSMSTRTSISDVMSGNNQDDKMSTVVEVFVDEQDNSPASNQVPLVNENKETIGQSQHTFDEEVNYQFGGMSPVPKEAKHFYQGAHI